MASRRTQTVSSEPVLPTDHPSLAHAVVGALAHLSNITKDRTANVEMAKGGSYGYRYADLGTTLDAVRPTLAAHGLAVTQDVTADANRVGVATTLIHTSGEKLTTGVLWMPAGSTPQAVGSSITYARRYQLMAVLGLAAEDDDGAAGGRPDERADLTVSQQYADSYLLRAKERGLTDDQIAALVDGITDGRTDNVRYILEAEKDQLQELTRRAIAARAASSPPDGPGSPQGDEATQEALPIPGDAPGAVQAP